MTIIERKPSNTNQLSETAFTVKVLKSPSLQFFANRISTPSVTLGEIPVGNPFSDNFIEGEKLTYDLLNIGIIADEDLSSYEQIYSWMVGIGFPETHEQFTSIVKDDTFRGGLKSDISVHILTNHFNANKVLTFKECFPQSLGPLELNSSGDLNPVVFDVSFRFFGGFTIQ